MTQVRRDSKCNNVKIIKTMYNQKFIVRTCVMKAKYGIVDI